MKFPIRKSNKGEEIRLAGMKRQRAQGMKRAILFPEIKSYTWIKDQVFFEGFFKKNSWKKKKVKKKRHLRMKAEMFLQ